MRTIYVTLFACDGETARNYIQHIQKRGAQDTLESMLVSLPLDGRKVSESKPWGMFSDTFTLGDYTLWWDLKAERVLLIEATDLDDEYSNV